MRYFLHYLIIISLSACSLKDPGKKSQLHSLSHTPPKIDTIATFIDSTNIAVPYSNKIFLASILIDDSVPKAIVRFYSKKNGSWQLKYAFEDEHWAEHVLMPKITDFNQDGHKDITYSTGTGARGGNSIMNMFIYDQQGDSLIYILNSNNYPNLYYNKETNSINAHILTGGIETVFMRLKKNELHPFASIFQDEHYVSVSEFDSTGQSKVLYIDSINKYEFFAHFVNYKPLKVVK